MKSLKALSDRCTMCGACMTAFSSAYFKTDGSKSSRIQVEEVTGMPKMRVCDQCGACIAVCPTKALGRDANGVIQLCRDKCTGCLMCVGFCDAGYMFFNAERQPEPFKCIACGLCAKACKSEALILMQN
jgi:Fe-S-cluster-containing hydrogenase component 2